MNYKNVFIAILLPIIALSMQQVLHVWLAPYVWFLFFPAVFFSAQWGGFWSGLISSFLSICLAWYFLIPPIFSWTLENPNQLTVFALFLGMGILISHTHERLHQAQLTIANNLVSEGEKQCSAILEQAAIGIALLTPEGQLLKANSTLCEILGYSHDELLQKKLQDITHPEDLATDQPQTQQIIAGDIQTYSKEKRFLRKNGTPLWINQIATLTRKADASPDYFIFIIQDIQHRKEVEALLQASEEKLRSSFSNAAIGFAMSDLQGRYLEANAAYSKITGYRLEQLQHQNFQGLIHPDDVAENLQLVDQLLAKQARDFVIENRYINKEGNTIWVRKSVSLVCDAQDQPLWFIALVEDISARKQAERDLIQLNLNLEQQIANRTAELTHANRELDSFAYSVSHDLRAPLRAMSGFSQALLEDYSQQLPDEARLFLSHINIASIKMNELVDGMLVLCRNNRSEMQMDDVDLSFIAEHLMKELATKDPERHVNVEIEPGLLVRGDWFMLEVLLRNLLENAWKYTARTHPANIRFYHEKSPNGEHYCVEDNGAGFDMVNAGRLFQPFQRLHRQEDFAGIGIGLATVRRIINRHGGEITAHGEIGKGAVFRFSLGTDTAQDTGGFVPIERQRLLAESLANR
ncbi:hypothetical protein JCM14076_14470 [Methylosoma difficile]